MRWTRAIAGVTAHEVNNAAHAIASALILARADKERAPLELLADVAARLQRLGSGLRVLARASQTPRSQRLDDICADAVVEVAPAGGAVIVDRISPEVTVQVDADALRAALASVISHALDASAGTLPVHVSTSVVGPDVTIEVAPSGGARCATIHLVPFESALAGTPDLRGDLRLILAATMVHEMGGVLLIGQNPKDAKDGRTLVLRLPIG